MLKNISRWLSDNAESRTLLPRADSAIRKVLDLHRPYTVTVESGGDLEYFTPRDRFLYRFPTRTRSQRIYELLSEEAPHLASPKLSQLAQAIVELDNEILDILEGN